MSRSLLIKNRRITIVLLSTVALICPVFYVFVDRPVAKFSRFELPSALKQIAEHTTGSGDWFLGLFAIIALIWLFVFKNKLMFRKFLFPLLSAALAGILANLLKFAVGRCRPKGFFQDGQYGFEPFSTVGYSHASMPSGHSAGIMATMAAVVILFPKWRIPCFAVAALIGSTRIILSAHYPGDVVAGLALGYLCAHWLYYLLVRCKQLPEPGALNDL